MLIEHAFLLQSIKEMHSADNLLISPVHGFLNPSAIGYKEPSYIKGWVPDAVVSIILYFNPNILPTNISLNEPQVLWAVQMWVKSFLLSMHSLFILHSLTRKPVLLFTLTLWPRSPPDKLTMPPYSPLIQTEGAPLKTSRNRGVAITSPYSQIPP